MLPNTPRLPPGVDAGAPASSFQQGLLLMLKALRLWASCGFLFLSFVLVPLPAGTLPSLFAHVASSPFSKQDLPAQYPADRGGLQSLGCAEGRSLLVLFLDLCSSTRLAPPEPHGSLGFILECKTLLFPLAVPFHPHLYLAPATWYKHRLPSDSLSEILNFLTDSMTAGLHACMAFVMFNVVSSKASIT